MSRYVVSLGSAVDFSPETTAAEIVQNIRTILSTRVGTVPLHRDFGISWEHVDKPYPVAKQLMMVEIIEAVEKFEPRAKVESVEFDESVEDAIEGLTKPRVIVSIEEEV